MKNLNIRYFIPYDIAGYIPMIKTAMRKRYFNSVAFIERNKPEIASIELIMVIEPYIVPVVIP